MIRTSDSDHDSSARSSPLAPMKFISSVSVFTIPDENPMSMS